GHSGAGLGVVGLSVALHAVFETPRDKIVWDVGHQGYPHKFLTGRADRMETLRQEGGLSGFLKRTESEYDAFGAGHAGTAISAGFGMAVARDLNGQDFKVVSIRGDVQVSHFDPEKSALQQGSIGDWKRRGRCPWSAVGCGDSGAEMGREHEIVPDAGRAVRGAWLQILRPDRRARHRHADGHPRG